MFDVIACVLNYPNTRPLYERLLMKCLRFPLDLQLCIFVEYIPFIQLPICIMCIYITWRYEFQKSKIDNLGGLEDWLDAEVPGSNPGSKNLDQTKTSVF